MQKRGVWWEHNASRQKTRHTWNYIQPYEAKKEETHLDIRIPLHSAETEVEI